MDHVRRRTLGRGICDASDDALGRNRRRDSSVGVERLQVVTSVWPAEAMEEPPRDAVLHRHHHRVASAQTGNLVGEPGNLVCLHRKYDGIEPDARVEVLGDVDSGMNRRRTIGKGDRQSVVANRRQCLAARDDVHLMSTGAQSCGHQATDRASTNNAKLHA